MNTNQIKEIAHETLKNIDFRYSNPFTRIALAIFAVVMLYSGLNIYSDKAYSKGKISLIQATYVNKEPDIMKEVLQGCKGDLYNPEVVKECYDESYKEKVKPYKIKIIKCNFYWGVWILFTIGFISCYAYLLLNQKRNRGQG